MEWTPEKPSVGDPVVFSVTVGNDGNLAATDSEVILEGVDVLDGSVILPRVPAGGSADANFKWTATQGEMNLAAAVDKGETLPDIDRANNATTKVYAATKLPDLVVSRIAWQPKNPAAGEEVAVALTVTNKGEGRASDTFMEYFVDGGFQAYLDVPKIEAGGSADASFKWTAKKGRA